MANQKKDGNKNVRRLGKRRGRVEKSRESGREWFSGTGRKEKRREREEPERAFAVRKDNGSSQGREEKREKNE